MAKSKKGEKLVELKGKMMIGLYLIDYLYDKTQENNTVFHTEFLGKDRHDFWFVVVYHYYY